MSRILMVDDDVLIARTVQFWLAQQGHVVIVAAGATDAVDRLRHDRFDLMLVDIFMPHMDGFDSVRLFHGEAPDVPLIALSGYAFAESHSPAGFSANGTGPRRNTLHSQAIQATRSADNH